MAEPTSTSYASESCSPDDPAGANPITQSGPDPVSGRRRHGRLLRPSSRAFGSLTPRVVTADAEAVTAGIDTAEGQPVGHPGSRRRAIVYLSGRVITRGEHGGEILGSTAMFSTGVYRLERLRTDVRRPAEVVFPQVGALCLA